MRRVIILGSTGSIGTQALDVIGANRERFEVVGLAAGSNRAAVAEQASAFGVEHTAFGAEEAEQLIRSVDADVVLNGITGSVGLGPTLAALEEGRTLALANKESLIVGGELVTSLAGPGQIVPVDSEHSAIAQALLAGEHREVRRLVLTASGGPFRGRDRASLRDVTPAQALAHPTWDMGLVVTTNSSTLVNKGLEVIEAHLLFDVPYDRIDVTVHPQSVIHSMVEYVDGSTIAQASPPDMRLPISLGLDWPHRVAGVGVPLDWTRSHSWTFEPLDEEAFPSVRLAKRVGEAGASYPAVFNAANEQAVQAFHAGRIGYLDILETVEAVVDAHSVDGTLTRESLAAAEEWARRTADERIAGV
ncbi:1-deoxy-D-xylulose-5-phosphate reductoisomerase [Rathayibacter sp. AY1G1]|jgi:1-deoxy-D-xylulose-5-phosphate reductoisomerase|uniref:1-deoxy-D-xylulose-5-phosphate reductoisomerase n=1 Tax=unclassified Rathayibacter TaxID=2609250 RepID=UPI000CE808B7|nr:MULTISPECIES: 1-deoxy-D-xylulose-5-phosphate reductoisomerase [unclassified Rathayibacter]PPF12844.1 1-deoxy-D-xylulose-5-phosphate reductoisomerase [Rathayibacter sp. AY1A5]PPF30122.1 1-deoxy-D-xylulose-5-phosphate reductoisomerase [Rathayibacter sp. AY1F2]PPF49274.1 1-deoxy-D-xylulose-5-phosphate reductoisomerase [Rathayibacter sp. AY1A1]PPG44849.1 1-deoxy-D-xylulose-5-phosphate reductoisomerase [Rathayibacter sp. AY2B5]PPG86754.1 1-deoxy-D-xylulose-5-phosphate reductoisomerase [Rathayiba